MTQTIPIFLASDDNYAPFVATTITSIVKNTEAFIGFYVLDGGIVDANKQKIEEIKKQFANFSIEYLNMKTFGLERFPKVRHYSVSAFSRYFIPEAKPNLNKILYMDVDIIVKGDIAQLYNHDIGDYPLGAILEDFYPYNYEYLKEICPEYEGGSNYFNTGVLLMNLDYFRKNNITQQLIDKTIELKDLIKTVDQEIFNLLFANNFKIIDYRFNVMPDLADYVLKSNKKTAIDALDNPVIIHYTSTKPWVEIRTKRALDFWEIAKLTPFYDELKIALYQTLSGSESLLIKNKILSKLRFGKKRAKYKQRVLEIQEKINILNEFNHTIFS